MIIHFFPKANRQSASSRFRVYLLAKQLQHQGHHPVIHQPPAHATDPWWSISRWRESLNYLIQITRIPPTVPIVLQRRTTPWEFVIGTILVKKLARKYLVFDFDDALYLANRRLTNLTIAHATKVIVSSRHLERYARTRQSHVYRLPTSLPLSLYHPTTPTTPPTIGWIGFGPTHTDNLRILIPVFRQLIRCQIPFKFKLVGAHRHQPLHKMFHFLKHQLEIIDDLDWSNPQAAPQLISTFAIGLLPLHNTPLNQARMAFKAVEYLACNVPVIATPVGEVPHLIIPKQTGLLATTTSEWFSAITSLLSQPQLRQSLGRQGRQLVAKYYSLSQYTTNFALALDPAHHG